MRRPPSSGSKAVRRRHQPAAPHKAMRKGSVPTREELVAYLETAEGKITKRELARAFRLKGAARVQLKGLLRQLEEEGVIARDAGRALRLAHRLPHVMVVEVTGIDELGDLAARPVHWERPEPPPPIHLAPPKGRAGPAVGVGERVLVRLRPAAGEPGYVGQIVKILEGAPKTVLGVFHGNALGGRVISVARKQRTEFVVAPEDTGGARDGELVLAEILPSRRGRHYGLKQARITECYGDVSDPRHISLIAIHQYGLRTAFPPAVLRQAERAGPFSMKGREDLRRIPLITIDPADARDHDDAVFAEADPDHPGGWHLIVAIADVAHYVRPGSPLDEEAYERGNSAYFPDRVVPMLPETLSADLCSLMPGVDRPCLAVHIWIDAEGRKRRHRFTRAVMRSAANLAYEQVEAAVIDGRPDIVDPDFRDSVLRPLYAAHEALARERRKRGALAIESDEREIILGEDGRVADVRPRARLKAHRVIEDMMIAANVAAAEELERRGLPLIYRVHEPPAPEKVEALREFLESLDYRWPRAGTITPRLFNRVLRHFRGTPHERLVNEVVLRTQMQARYDPENQGHFGLALKRYVHFTSPIRRYADLVIHRALLHGLGFSDAGFTEMPLDRLDEIAAHISSTERIAEAAERDTQDRYLAAYLEGQMGAVLRGRITGVTRFGLFVTLEPSGGTGLIPISALGADWYAFDEKRHLLEGQRMGRSFRLGDVLKVRLVEAEPITGAIRLALVDKEDSPAAGRRSSGRRRPKAGTRKAQRAGQAI